MMSPKRDQRILPQANLIQQQQQQVYGQMPPQPQQQQQQMQQYQYQSQVLPQGPPTYLPQQYAPNPVNGATLMRVGPRMLPLGVPTAGVVPGNGVISSAMPQSAATVRIPLGYYSQHPSMVPVAPQMAYSSAMAAAGGVPIPQTNNPNPPAASYYGDLLQHPLQVSTGRSSSRRAIMVTQDGVS